MVVVVTPGADFCWGGAVGCGGGVGGLALFGTGAGTEQACAEPNHRVPTESH